MVSPSRAAVQYCTSSRRSGPGWRAGTASDSRAVPPDAGAASDSAPNAMLTYCALFTWWFVSMYAWVTATGGIGTPAPGRSILRCTGGMSSGTARRSAS